MWWCTGKIKTETYRFVSPITEMQDAPGRIWRLMPRAGGANGSDHAGMGWR
jgi:hypothetical protein